MEVIYLIYLYLPPRFLEKEDKDRARAIPCFQDQSNCHTYYYPSSLSAGDERKVITKGHGATYLQLLSQVLKTFSATSANFKTHQL